MDSGTSDLGSTSLKCETVTSAELSGAALKVFYYASIFTLKISENQDFIFVQVNILSVPQHLGPKQHYFQCVLAALPPGTDHPRLKGDQSLPSTTYIKKVGLLHHTNTRHVVHFSRCKIKKGLFWL